MEQLTPKFILNAIRYSEDLNERIDKCRFFLKCYENHSFLILSDDIEWKMIEESEIKDLVEKVITIRDEAISKLENKKNAYVGVDTPIRLTKKLSKANLLMLFDILFKQGAFEHIDKTKRLTEKRFMVQFGKFLNDDFSGYQKNISPKKEKSKTPSFVKFLKSIENDFRRIADESAEK